MNNQKLIELVEDLTKQSNECEWIEFKLNFHSIEEIGKTISAISNSLCIKNLNYGYLIFGIDDSTKAICGTSFQAKSYKKGNEELENWLIQRLNPRIDFSIYEFDYDSTKHISLFVIPATKNLPVKFFHQSYIRVGSINRNLADFPEKESIIWKKDSTPFEKEIAKGNLTAQDVVSLLGTESYFDLLKLPYPTTQQGVINKLIEEGLIFRTNSYAISKLGALLFGKNLKDFESIERKSIRVIVYKGTNKVETQREQISTSGYALGFKEIVNWITSQLPANEEIGKVLREQKTMYPDIAIRELIANALIHQDLAEKGFPMVEIFKDRIEISNSGIPFVAPERFIDAYYSRNEKMADLMRRMGFCEEKGSGLDKVIYYNELYQLPPINVVVSENRTRVTIYSYRTLNNLDAKEKIRACYQHACLKYVSNEKMTNQSLRDRFKIENQNYAIASRIIRDTLLEGLIKEDNPENKSRKYASYVPYWA